MTQSEAPQLVGSEQLAPLLQAAAASTRKRSHLLLHADQQDRVQRLLIALEPVRAQSKAVAPDLAGPRVKADASASACSLPRLAGAEPIARSQPAAVLRIVSWMHPV